METRDTVPIGSTFLMKFVTCVCVCCVCLCVCVCVLCECISVAVPFDEVCHLCASVRQREREACQCISRVGMCMRGEKMWKTYLIKFLQAVAPEIS